MSYQPPPGPPAYQQQPYQPPQSSGKATTSLVLGIISLVSCGLFLGIPAMIVGRQAKREIAESGGRLGGEGLATAGFVTGLIGTIWSVIAGLLVIAVFVFGGLFANEFAKNCTATSDQDGNTTVDCNNP
jgi:hypothetical protein